MGTIYTIQSAFNGGEIGSDEHGRVDLKKYGDGVKTMLNFFPHPWGGASNRTGTKMIAEVKDSSKKTRLVPFQFSVLQAYVLEFGHNYIRVYKDGGQVVNGGNPVEITTTYTESELFDLKFAQSADVLYICHPAHAPATLTRSSHTSWTLADYAYKNGPFRVENIDETKTITPSGKTGTITLTANFDIFDAKHIGSLWKIRHRIDGQKLEDRINATPGVLRGKGQWEFSFSGRCFGNLSIERSVDGTSNWSTIKSFAFSGDYNSATGSGEVLDSTLDDKPTSIRIAVSAWGAADGQYSLAMLPHNWSGIVKITAVTDARTATATVITELGSTAATSYWSEGAWSLYRGYPRCVKFFQNRLAMAGSDDDPQTLWLSDTGDYVNYKIHETTTDDDSITAPLVSQGVNEIRAMVSLEELLLFTRGGEWKLGPASDNAAITPTSTKAVQIGYRGANNLEPIIIGNRVLFVQEMGSTVRDFGYSLQDYTYTGTDVTILSRHLFRNHKIIDWAYQQEPDSIVRLVRDDGVLLAFTYLKEQDVWAWSRHTTQGYFESVTTIPGDGYDEAWFVVRRTINGNTKRFVERLAPRLVSTNPADQFFVDCGLSYEGTPITTISGLDHLNGMTVKVLADGNVLPDVTVTNGGFTLDNPASKVHAGLGYTCDLETLNIDFQAKDGTIQGRKKRIPSVTLRLENSRGGKVGMDADHLQEFESEFVNWGEAAPLITGDRKANIYSEYNTEGRIFIRQDDPLPITVLAIMAEVEVGG